MCRLAAAAWSNAIARARKFPVQKPCLVKLSDGAFETVLNLKDRADSEYDDGHANTLPRFALLGTFAVRVSGPVLETLQCQVTRGPYFFGGLYFFIKGTAFLRLLVLLLEPPAFRQALS